MSTFRKLTVPFTLLGMLTLGIIFLLLYAAGGLYDAGIAGLLLSMDVFFGIFWLVIYCYFPNHRILMFIAAVLGALASLGLGPAIGIYNMLQREKKIDERLGIERKKAKEAAHYPVEGEEGEPSAPEDEVNVKPEDVSPAEEPASEPPVAEEAKTEEPVAEEMATEEMKAEEAPASEEPAPEEEKAEEPVMEEPKAEEAPAPEEPTPEEKKAEEAPAAEEPAAEEAAPEEPAPDEAAQ